MLVSINWLKDYVDLQSFAPQEIVDKFSNCSAEAGSLQKFGDGLQHILSAIILAVKKHPQADRLSLVTIDCGQRQLEVICGANNFNVGDIVAYAGVGCVLPDGTKIKAAKIRGIVSEGMLCSEAELNLTDDDQGIYILPPDTKIGVSLDQLFPDHIDYVFEIDNQSITNRPDLWGYFGLAREIAVLFDLPTPSLNLNPSIFNNQPPLIEIDIKSKSQVPRLSCQVINQVAVTKSPDWLRFRLHRVGQRAIDNLVDITNYVMLDLGQPMHVFDLDKVPSKKLTIQQAVEGEVLKTLYRTDIKLSNQDLAFYEGGKATSLCGVIGGLDSAIGKSASNILLEAGSWLPAMVRKTAIRHNLKTEAAQRFEKALDPELTIYGLIKAWQLLLESCPQAKLAGGLFDNYNVKADSVIIKFNPEFTNKLLGISVSVGQQKKILQKLGFSLQETSADNWLLTVPSWRATKDIKLAEDVVEEIGRIHGYHNIKPIAPLFPVVRPTFNQLRSMERATKNYFAARNYQEVMNFPFTNEQEEKFFGQSKLAAIDILNPSNSEHQQLKTSLLPHLLLNIQNMQRLQSNFGLFELAKIYFKKQQQFLEKYKFILCLNDSSLDRLAKFKKITADLFGWAKMLDITPIIISPDDEAKQYIDTNISCKIIYQKRQLGHLFMLSSLIKSDFKLDSDPIFVIIDWDQLLLISRHSTSFKQQSKFPPVFFDISVVINFKQTFAEVAKLIYGLSKDVQQVLFKDRYLIPNSQDVSLTLSVVFRSMTKTFSSKEVLILQQKVIDGLAKQSIFLKK